MMLFCLVIAKDKVSVTVRDLIIKLVIPGISQNWERLVCESTIYNWLLKYLSFNQHNNIRPVANSFNECSKFSRVLILMSFIFKNQLPLSFLKLLETLNFVLSDLLELFSELSLLFLIQYVSPQHKPFITLASGFSTLIYAFKLGFPLLETGFIHETDCDRHHFFSLKNWDDHLVNESDVIL